MSRQGIGSPRCKPLGILSILQKAKQRKSWSFEKLEDRLVFSATPYTAGVFQTVSYSNDTPEGQLATLLAEMQWNAMQSGANNSAVLETTMSLPNDPLFPNQWHLLNTGQETGSPDFLPLYGVAGQDINVVPVWNQGITGEGVKVAIIDSGVQLFHPDLVGNIDPILRYNATTGTNNASPNLFDASGNHGTSVAGLVGASWNNLGDPVLDEDGNPVVDLDGNIVYSGGGSGVAPNATIVPIRIGFGPQDFNISSQDTQIENAWQYVLENDIDVTNNSYGPGHQGNRFATPLTDTQLLLLRNMALFGRDGLGIVNVFASGNSGGPSFSPGFQSFGNYDNSSYNHYANVRYNIIVTGVDHDGQYRNADGTFTSYPVIGPNVLVASPTGSNVAQNVGQDFGQGSGIYTTDLVGDFGYNAAPLPSGLDNDLSRDLLGDPDYTSRFNGTSAAAPIATGVIALMLEANPNLTYRDVQEILVRSARQNAPLETPSSGSLSNPQSTWQTNQVFPFQNPDPYDPAIPAFIQQQQPRQDVNNQGFQFIGQDFAPDGNDGGRQFSSGYEPQVALFTNGAGYTVSQGYGVYGENIGYAHGVIDAELAVAMAKQWHILGQNSDPFTEKTFTTFVVQPGANVPAAERLPLNHGGFLIPGGIGGRPGGGFSAYWDEYYSTTPFANYTGPSPEARGESYIDFSVPADQAIDIEWVEVRVDISGGLADLDHLRMFLTSPDGTQSELGNTYIEGSAFSPFTTQFQNTLPGIEPDGDIDADGGTFVWTFATNRSWGENSNTAVVIDPVTGEPVTVKDFQGTPILPVFRDWEFHLENWSNSAFVLGGIEVVWHGKAIGLDADLKLPDGTTYGNVDPNWGVSRAQRIQGFIGVDTNGDEAFNYSRSVQTVFDSDNDPDTIRMGDVIRRLDFNDTNNNGIYEPELGDTSNLEPFAENVVVEAYRINPVTGLADVAPTARFLTGADGNYYFDLDPTFEYEIRISDPLNRPKLEDVDTPSQYLQHYKQVWRITPDWFFAADRDNGLIPGNNPAEAFFGMSDANGDGITTASPLPYLDVGAPVPSAVRNINFLLKQDAVAQQFDVQGTVYSDVNGNGVFDGVDAPLASVFVYQDVNRNGIADSGEQRVQTDATGKYTLTIPADHLDTYAIGVIPPTNLWLFTEPGKDGVENVFAGPGSPVQNVNFFLDPPGNPLPPGGVGLANIQGVLYDDLNANGVHEPGEVGIPNIRVFLDTNTNGVWDSATEQSVLTQSNGSYSFGDVSPGLIRIDIVLPNENTPAAVFTITSPAQGFREVLLGAGGSVIGADFGLDNHADNDWGDLPDSYGTTSAANGPHHFITPGFQLGAGIDGEVNGIPTPNASGEGQVGDNDDGVVIVSNGGLLKQGANTLRVAVQGVGGLLTGWMDFNFDGHFDESERLSWSLNGNNLGGEADLNPGTWDLQITVPAGTPDGALFSRFRWGEPGLSFTGPAQIGEVEDYVLGLNFLFGDYNHNGKVDNADYNVWRNTVGQVVAPFTGADGNGDGTVNQADYSVWRANYGQVIPGPGAGAGALVAEGGSGSGVSSGGLAAALAADSSSLVVGGSSSGVMSPMGPSVSIPVVVTQVNTQVDAGVSPSGQNFAFIATNADVATVSRSALNASQRTVAASSSNSNLLLLDLAWAGVDRSSFDFSEDALCDTQHEETNVSDLALAAVMSDEAEWWDAI